MYKELKETQLKCINCCCCLLLYRRHCLSLYQSTCCTRTFVYIMGRHHQEWIDFHSFDSPMPCRPTAVYIFTQHDRQHHQYCVQFNLKYSFSNRAPFCFLNVDAGEIHRVPISMPSDEIDIRYIWCIAGLCVSPMSFLLCACPFYFHLFLYVCVDWITWIFEIPAGCNIATTTTPCVCGSPPPHLVGTSHCVCVYERGLLCIEPK